MYMSWDDTEEINEISAKITNILKTHPINLGMAALFSIVTQASFAMNVTRERFLEEFGKSYDFYKRYHHED